MPQTHLDGLIPLLTQLRSLGLARPLVHIIDAEGDSVYHLRRWQRDGHLFVVRTDEQRVVQYQGCTWSLPDVALRLRQRGLLSYCRPVSYQGRSAWQYVGEAAVVLHRRACLHRTRQGQRYRQDVPGEPLPVRLVVSEVRSADGTVLARWLLLSNVPAAVPAATVALWYYWRWQVESYFKLLKTAGQQVEHWQQEDGRGVLKRLLVASMACVLAWRLGHSQAPPAEEARRVVMSLSGRQVEHGKDFTLEGLLAGTWVLLALAALLKQTPATQVQQMADFVLSGSVQTSTQPLTLRDTG